MPTRIASRSLPVLLLACLLVLLAKAATLTGRASVVSGDTIEIHGTLIRLHGIDAPERKQTCRRDHEVWRCGQQAALALQRRIDDRPVRCTEWHRPPEGDGHIVAKCLVDGEDLSEWLLRNGWAVAYVYYSYEHARAELFAKSNRRGIWAGAFVRPWNWRRGERLP